jgi:hypothetical protein
VILLRADDQHRDGVELGRQQQVHRLETGFLGADQLVQVADDQVRLVLLADAADVLAVPIAPLERQRSPAPAKGQPHRIIPSLAYELASYLLC